MSIEKFYSLGDNTIQLTLMNMNMPGMKESMKSHDKHMEKHKAAKGEQFDTMFLTMMINHHTAGMKMTHQAQKKPSIRKSNNSPNNRR